MTPGSPPARPVGQQEPPTRCCVGLGHRSAPGTLLLTGDGLHPDLT